MTEWIISGNPKKYNVVDAFRELKKIDWTQSANIEAGDIVYIYVSGDIKALRFKCRANKVDIKVPDIEDQKFNISGEYDGHEGRYMELEMLDEFEGPEYMREELMNHGFQSPMGPVRMPSELKSYLTSLETTEAATDDTKKYTVNQSVWIAAALLSMEIYSNNPSVQLTDYYLKQATIVHRAQSIADKKVDGARCSWWCCADQERKANNYLRGDLPNNTSLRRLTRFDEFPEKTHPEDLDMSDILQMNGRDILMEELFYFVEHQYPEAFMDNQTTDINYIEVLEYLKDNQEVPYSNPDAAGIDAAERNRLLKVKENGQKTVAEIKKMAQACEKAYGLDKCLPVSWLDGSNTKTRKYLWAQMKYNNYVDNPTSISIFVEMKNKTESRYRISLELKNDGTAKDLVKKYHSYLDLPIDPSAGLTLVSGSNELGCPEPLNETLEQIKAGIESGKYRKVQLCKYIDKIDGEPNEFYHKELMKAVSQLLPYYNHVIGKDESTVVPKPEPEKPVVDTEEANMFDKNMILYGPPGTGKTYSTAKYAVKICDGDKAPDLKDYNAVMNRYRVLMSEHRISFVTFHQSYGYEEFIEGIKPLMPKKKDDNGPEQKEGLKYDIVDGVFKEFCSRAKNDIITTDKFTVSDTARIWKATVRAEVKQDCFDNDRVRIDWGFDSDGAYGFVNDIHAGDIIITTDGSRSVITGIAVAKEDDAYSMDDSESDATTRDVQWLAKDLNEDIVAINGDKILHRKTVARVPRMSVGDLIKIAVKHNPELQDTKVAKNKQPYVFIIDEINRGNISKIFGELITLIEDTKRDGMEECIPATLPYSGDPFTVPENVYIIGTMNTADRSIALMDTALRRRFQFVEMMPDTQVLRDIHADKVKDLDVAAMLDTINERITFLYDREHTIGHAFFTKLAKSPTVETLKTIFEKSVIPLLQEYFYEDYQKIQLVLGDNGKTDPKIKFIKDEKVEVTSIFKGSADDVIDLPDFKYSVNKDALSDLESYKQIM